MARKLKLPVEAMMVASMSAYHNDLFDPDLFDVTPKAMPNLEGVDCILVEINTDEAAAKLRNLVRNEDALVRKAPAGTRWSGSKGHVCVMTRDLGLRNWMGKFAKHVVGRRIVL